jgi:hypothetical protein
LGGEKKMACSEWFCRRRSSSVIAATGEVRNRCRLQLQPLAGAAAGTGAAAAAGASVPAGVAAVGRSGSLVLGAAALDRISSRRKKQQKSTGVAAGCSRSSSRQQEQQLSAGAAEAGVVEAVASSATSVDAAATATTAICEKTKVAVLERRAGARAQTLARRRGSEASDVLRSPEPAMPELEISWMSEEREEQEEEECGKKLELDLEPPLPEPNKEQECQLPRQQGLFLLLIKKP